MSDVFYHCSQLIIFCLKKRSPAKDKLPTANLKVNRGSLNWPPKVAMSFSDNAPSAKLTHRRSLGNLLGLCQGCFFAKKTLSSQTWRALENCGPVNPFLSLRGQQKRHVKRRDTSPKQKEHRFQSHLLLKKNVF